MIRDLIRRYRFAQFSILHKRSLAAQKRWQEKHLRRIVRHASTHVPLWHARFADSGLDASAIRHIEDLSRLQTTSKYTYIGKMTEEYIDNSRLSRSVWYVTSGTSGTPFRFLMSDNAYNPLYSDFASMRFLWWLGEPLKRLATIRLARIKIRGPSTAYRLFVPVEEFLTDTKAAIERIARFDAEIISAYPSILIEMARFIHAHPEARWPKLKFILSFGEMLAPSVRAYVSRVLGAEIYDRYGLEEIGAIGVECAEHDGFHVNTESLIVEVTDDSYTPITDKDEGRLVVTDLFNYNMPFIRYDTGDRARISYEQCACGLRSPRIWIQGRYSAYLTFPHRRIHHLEFDGTMDGFMNHIFLYQVAKQSDTEVRVRIIPGTSYQPHIQKKIQESVGALVGESVHVSVEVVDSLPLSPRGKSRIVIDESTNRGA